MNQNPGGVTVGPPQNFHPRYAYAHEYQNQNLRAKERDKSVIIMLYRYKCSYSVTVYSGYTNHWCTYGGVAITPRYYVFVRKRAVNNLSTFLRFDGTIAGRALREL